MPIYEYKCDMIKCNASISGGVFDSTEIENRLNYFSKEGWEFINATVSNKESGRSKFLLLFFRKEIIQ